MSWSEAQINDLTRLWAEGVPISKIGKVIGKTRNAVAGKVNRVGLQSRPSPIIRFKNRTKLPKPKVFLKSTDKTSSRGKCQWIEGEIIPGGASDEIKCLKPTVYNQYGKLTSWCKEHHEIVWRPDKVRIRC